MTTTLVFKEVGSGPQYWTCPPGVTSIAVEVTGGAGGGNIGGYPGRALGTLAVTPGQVLQINVGGQGQPGGAATNNPGGVAGYNGGGVGGAIGAQGSGYTSGAGGGGASDIRTGAYALADRVAVGAGGGGEVGRSGSAGANGGGTTGATATQSPNSATGGSQVAGGQALRSGSNTGLTIYNGSLGQGGNAPSNPFFDGPGGGGAGYYGGASGMYDNTTAANNCGGGGGSNYVGGLTSTTNTQGYSVNGRGNGYVIFTYNQIPVATPFYPATGSTILRSSPYTFTWIYNDADGDGHSSSDFRYRLVGAASWTTVVGANTTTAAVSRTLLSYSLTATLTAGATYEWQVQSTDSAGGTSGWSASSYFIDSATPGTPPPAGTGGIELEIYNGKTGAFLDGIPQRLDPTYLEEFGTGGGSFTLQLADARIARTQGLLNLRNVVRVKVHGAYVGFWIIQKLEPVWIDSDEYKGQAVKVSGEGPRGAWFPDAVMYPENPNLVTPAASLINAGGSPPTVRNFGFNSASTSGHWYSIPQWQGVVYQVAQSSVVAWNTGTASGNPWPNIPANWPVAPNASWISWTNTRGTNGDFNGFIYFRLEFLYVDGAPLQFFLAGDDALVVYLDGAEIANNAAFGWFTTTSTDSITVSPGLHVLTAVLQQKFWTFTSPGNPDGFLMAVFKVGDANVGTAASLLFDSSYPYWTVSGHPGTVPGWTTGDILQTVITEAQARGVTSFSTFVDLGFNWLVDSYGFQWPSDGTQWQFDIGAGYDDVIDALESVNCDVWFAPDLSLQAAPIRGVDRSVIYPGDTYDTVIGRLAPYSYYPLSTAPNGSSQWTYGAAKAATASHLNSFDNVYAQAMPSPAVLTGMQLSMTFGQVDVGSIPTPDTLTLEYAFEFWAAVPLGNALIFTAIDGGLGGGHTTNRFVSLDIQDAKDTGTGVSIPGVQQLYLSFADDSNITGGLTGLIANYPADKSTQAFFSTGAQQNYVVPAGITSVLITARGGNGGNFSTNHGGSGSVIKGTLAVTPGETLAVFVGGDGGTPTGFPGGSAGFNGGGLAGSSSASGHLGGGGGAGGSDVRQGGTALSNRVIIAGGGGGASAAGAGGGGGALAGTGTAGNGADGGGGGTQSAGGTGHGTVGGAGGTLGFGGAGAGTNTVQDGGAGGGGGYYGGAGGGFEAGTGNTPSGGGGGSSYAGGCTSTSTLITGSVGGASLTAGSGACVVITALPLVESHHYVLQYHDDGGQAVWEVYRDNVLFISAPANPGHSLTQLTADFRNFGTFGLPTSITSIAAFAIYKRRLTRDEILLHYRAGIGAFNPVTEPVVFSVGSNVLSASSALEFRAKTTLVVASKTQTAEQAGAASTMGRYGRIEGYYDGSSLNQTDARTVAAATMDNLFSTLTSSTLEIFGNYVPWRDFGVGDWVLAPPDVTTRTNRVRNSSFENGAFSPSFLASGVTLAVVTPTIPTIDGGAFAMRMTFGTSSPLTVGAVMNNIWAAVVPGRSYSFSMYVYTTSATVVRTNASTTSVTSGTNNVWERIGGTFIASSNETTLSVVNVNSTTSGEIVYIDCVLLEEVSSIQPYFGELTPGAVVDTNDPRFTTIQTFVTPDSPLYTLARKRIMSISVTEDADTRRPVYAVEIDSINQDNDRRLARWLARTTPQGSLNGVIPNPLTPGNS